MGVTITKAYVEERIQIDPKTKCWNWTGLKNSSGHPIGKGWTNMHRAVKELYDGHIFAPAQMADHMCRNSGCVNPAHIRITNRAVNSYHRDDARAGSLNARRLRVVRFMHDGLVQRYLERTRTE